MRIVYFSSDNSGCGNYRMIVPANIIAKNNLAEVKVSFEVNDEIMQWADVIIWQRQYKPNLLNFAKKYKGIKKQIFELDDDLFSLTPANPAYVHYPNSVLKQLIEFIKVCDAVICSTDPLREVLLKYNSKVYTVQNCILSNYIIAPNEIKDEIRIGWVGSAHHHDDLKYAIHAVKEAQAKYKNVKLVFMGGTVDKYFDMFDRSRMEFHTWVDFKDYYDKLNSLNLHIGLAPIEDNKFNCSKSSLRFLEYSLCGAATIASDVYPYTNAIENGKDGIIVKKNKHTEWVKSLNNLIENPSKITELCSNSQIKIIEKYDYYKNIGSWVNVYNEVLGETKRVIINSEVTTINVSKSAYELWAESVEPTQAELEIQKTAKQESTPKISILPNCTKNNLEALLGSLSRQTYSNWEVCLLDSSIYTIYVDRFTNITNKISGDYVYLLEEDDVLPPFSLYEVAKYINENKDTDIIYGNEDLLEDGHRVIPNFKPMYSPETLINTNYINNSFIFSSKLLDKFDISNIYSMLDSVKVGSLQKILRHTSQYNRPYKYKTLPTRSTPKVSIIIPNKNQYSLLSKCISSIINLTTYKNYEIIIVENGSTDSKVLDYYSKISKLSNIKIITWDEEEFNYQKINNFAVAQADGEFILFLNNDTEALNPDWLTKMVDYAVVDGVGIVGAKLLYSDNTLQHAGVFIGYGGIDHTYKKYPRDYAGYMNRLTIPHNVTAVTGACLLIEKSILDEVDGFDEGYPIAFGDIDLCMKVKEKGYRIVFTPLAELYHHESKSRGYEDSPEKVKRLQMEITRFVNKWGDFNKMTDDYYTNKYTLKGVF